MFPRHVLEFIIKGSGISKAPDDVAEVQAAQAALASSHQDVTILFMDIVGFTAMSKEIQPAQVMGYLNAIFTLLDEFLDQYGVFKVGLL